MELGTAKLCITPETPLRMCGYANRPLPYSAVRQDIHLRVHLLRHAGKGQVWIYADVLWWGTDMVQNLRPKVAVALGLPEANVFFCASHNHSGPPTGARFIGQLEEYNPAYGAFLEGQVLKAIAAAQADLQTVALRRHTGECALNVYRRVELDGGIQMRPNYAVAPDRALTLLAFTREDGSLKGAMVHYACHANVAGTNELHPDYPGIALCLLDEKYPGSVSLFLQGCTADLRPNCVLGDRFRTGTYEDAAQFGAYFAESCTGLLEKGQGEEITPALAAWGTTADLPQTGLLTEEQLQTMAQTEPEEAKRQWAAKVLERGNSPVEQLAVGRAQLGEGCAIYTFAAEMTQNYAAFARQKDPGAICAAYTNGMEGYVCGEEHIRQGGYEPDGSALYFALAGKYTEQVQQNVQSAMLALEKEGKE